MNERIQNLAEQAWDATAVSPDFGHPVSFAEKFAELLIRECAAVADNWVNNEDNGKNLVSDKLKEHFGVKE